MVGSGGADFHPALVTDRVEEVFHKGEHKAAYSGFEGHSESGETLADWLRSRSVTEVEVVGIATDHCVRATALDAVAAGFRTRVLIDYTVGVAPHTVASTLDDFQRAGVEVSGQTPVTVQ